MVNKVTLKEIAEKTGLAMNTVSRVINKRPYYSKEVEEKVLKAVDDLGYIKNNAASALKTGSSKLIGIVFDDFVNPYYSFMTNIVASKFVELNYNVMIFSNYSTSPFLTSNILRQILAHNIEGIITFLQPDEEAIKLINKNGVHIVLLGRDSRSYGIDSIFGNDFECGRLATLHLIEKGFKKIIYLGSDQKISVDNMRFAGYKKALSEHNIPFDGSLVTYFVDFKEADKVAAHIVNNLNARAIFCFNDHFAFRIIKEFAKRGLSFPKDYSLIGCDNIQSFLSLPNILTTVKTDSVKMANISLEILLNKINNNLQHSQNYLNESFTVELVEGQTT